MNLIEQLGEKESLASFVVNGFGGYEKAKAVLNNPNSSFLHNTEALKQRLLEYRRENNIFERNDHVVNRDKKYSDELNVVSSSNYKALWFFNKSYGGFVKSQFRHATPKEIEQGYRDE